MRKFLGIYNTKAIQRKNKIKERLWNVKAINEIKLSFYRKVKFFFMFLLLLLLRNVLEPTIFVYEITAVPVIDEIREKA